MSGQRHVPAALAREEGSVAIEQGAEWVLGPVWMFLEMRSTRIGIRTPIQPGHKSGYVTLAPSYVYANLESSAVCLLTDCC